VFFSDREGRKISWLLPACATGSGMPSELNSGPRQCEPCPQGKHNDGSISMLSICSKCPAHSTTNQGDWNCTCEAGYYRDTYSGNGDGACVKCHRIVVTGSNAQVVVTGSRSYCPGSGDRIECPFGETTFGKAVAQNFCLGGDCFDQPLAPIFDDDDEGASSAGNCSCCFGKQLDEHSNACSACHDPAWWDAQDCSTCVHALWCASNTSAPGAKTRARSGFQLTHDSQKVYTCAHPSHCWWSSHPRNWWALSREECLANQSKNYDQRIRGCTRQEKNNRMSYLRLHRLHCIGVQVGVAANVVPMLSFRGSIASRADAGMRDSRCLAQLTCSSRQSSTSCSRASPALASTRCTSSSLVLA